MFQELQARNHQMFQELIAHKRGLLFIFLVTAVLMLSDRSFGQSGKPTNETSKSKPAATPTPTPPVEINDDDVIRVNSNLVVVPVSVSDKSVSWSKD